MTLKPRVSYRIPTSIALALALVSATSGCATQRSAARAVAARELGCPEDSIRVVGDDKRMYHASGCGASVRITCHDPYDSTGAAWGWTDPLTSGKRSQCDALVGQAPPSTSDATAKAAPTNATTTTTSAQVRAFDRDLAAKLLGAAVERARTCGAPKGPRGDGRARVTFANDGSVERVELEAPFAESEAGRCVEREMMRVSLTRFDDGPVTVKKVFFVE